MINRPLPVLVYDNRITYIYVLSDPSMVSESIYVGMTVDPKHRLAKHLTPSRLKDS